MSDLTQFNSGYLLNSSLNLTEVTPSNEIDDFLPYQYEKTIYQNGDQYWDSEEWYVLSDITIPAGETFDVLIITEESNEIGALLMEGDTTDEQNQAIS